MPEGEDKCLPLSVGEECFFVRKDDKEFWGLEEQRIEELSKSKHPSTVAIEYLRQKKIHLLEDDMRALYEVRRLEYRVKDVQEKYQNNEKEIAEIDRAIEILETAKIGHREASPLKEN